MPGRWASARESYSIISLVLPLEVTAGSSKTLRGPWLEWWDEGRSWLERTRGGARHTRFACVTPSVIASFRAWRRFGWHLWRAGTDGEQDSEEFDRAEPRVVVVGEWQREVLLHVFRHARRQQVELRLRPEQRVRHHHLPKKGATSIKG